MKFSSSFFTPRSLLIFCKLRIVHLLDTCSLGLFLCLFKPFLPCKVSRYFTNKSFQKKRSDTLFILASGSSLSKLTSAQWDLISSHDVFTFNYGYLLNVEPDFYMLELDLVSENGDRFLLSILEDLNLLFSNAYRANVIFKPMVPNIFKTLASLFFVCRRISFPCSLLLNIWSPSSYLSLATQRYRLLSSLSPFLPYPFPSENFILRGSLEQAISFGLSHNYSEVIICGADLSGPYFYDVSPDLIREGFHAPTYDQTKNRSNPFLHRTNDTSVHPITISDIIKLHAHTAKQMNIRLSVADASSPLSSFLPIYHWPPNNSQ